MSGPTGLSVAPGLNLRLCESRREDLIRRDEHGLPVSPSYFLHVFEAGLRDPECRRGLVGVVSLSCHNCYFNWLL